MSYLLDTHTLLWWLDNDPSLPAASAKIIANATNVIFVSSVSAWEISIKKTIGKLQAPDNLEQAIAVNHFEPLNIKISHGVLAGSLPPYHNDPFDRMLIAQAKSENLSIITKDSQFAQYGVSTIWD